MSRMILFTLLLSLIICGCGKSDDTKAPPQQQTADNEADTGAIAAKILGSWTIDVPRSIEKVKTSPKAQTSDPAFIASNVEKTAEKVKMQITEAEMICKLGGREQMLSYTVASVDPQVPSVTLSLNDNPDVTIVFTVVDGAYVNFVSSATDDMNYYIWKQTE